MWPSWVSRSCDEMEAAVHALLLELGEDPRRPGLAGAARRYVGSLLASTAGYGVPVPAARHALTSAPAAQAAVETEAAAVEVPTALRCGCCVLASEARGLSRGPSPALPAAGGEPCPAGEPGTAAAAARSQGAARASGGAAVVLERLHGGVAAYHLRFASQCEHHMLPFYGRLMVALAAPSGDAASSGGGGTAAGAAQPLSGEAAEPRRAQAAAVAAQGLGAAGAEAEPRVCAERVEALVTAITRRLQVGFFAQGVDVLARSGRGE